MSGELDESTERAWKHLRTELADRISRLDDDADFVSLEVPEATDRRTPFARAWLTERRTVFAQVSSNRVLHEDFRLGKAARHRLRESGWEQPSIEQTNYWVEIDAAYVDRLAVMMVTAMRESFGVIHPSFLKTEPALDDVDASTPTPLHGEPLAVSPEGDDHLNGLIDQALIPVCDGIPVRDGDGDIPFAAGASVVFVRLLPGVPVIRLFAPMVLEVTKPRRAVFEVAVLNRDVHGVKFVLHHGVVTASLDLCAWPFAPDHLRQFLAMMREVVEKHTPDLAHRVRGRCFAEPGATGTGR